MTTTGTRTGDAFQGFNRRCGVLQETMVSNLNMRELKIAFRARPKANGIGSFQCNMGIL
jgi:hypothetical protein